MASPDDVPMDNSPPNTHQPFTIEENIHQLNAIDKSVAKLMSHVATALGSLTATQSSSTTSTAEPDGLTVSKDSQEASFKSATDNFLTALHSVDVKMKRQIFALEEAGIVSLASEGPRAPQQVQAKASLKPDGRGTVGNLDIGWLNSRGTRVERDMEAELWEGARDFLEENGEELKKA